MSVTSHATNAIVCVFKIKQNSLKFTKISTRINIDLKAVRVHGHIRERIVR